MGTRTRVYCWPTVFCSDEAVPIDNNVSEREMKRVVLNRKNLFFVDGVARRLHEHWGERLVEAERRYTESRNSETRVAYLRVLGIFADLVLRHEIPQD